MPRNFFEYSEPREAFLDKNLAKLGDALVNLIYSLAMSEAKMEPDGAKAPNEVLSNALSEADFRHLAPSRADSHQLADVVEAIVAYAWLKDEIGLEESVKILSDPLSDSNLERRRDVFKGAEEGFKNLLIEISKRISLE